MPDTKLNTINISFRLFDSSNKAVNNLAVEVQYFDGKTEKWIGFADNTIKNGQLEIELSSTRLPRPSQQIRNFWTLLEAKYQPNLRIVTKNKVFQTSKQEVLSIAYDRSLNKRSLRLSFDFGLTWLLPENMLKEIDRYRDFILIAVPYMPLSQTAGVATVKRLENQLKISKENIHRFENDKIYLNKEIERYQDVVESINNQLLQKNNQLKAKQKEISELKKFQADVVSLSKENRNLQDSLNAVSANYENLITQNVNLNNRIKESESELVVLRNQLNDAQRKFQLVQKEKNTILDRLREIESQGALDSRPIALSSFSSKIIDEFEKTDIENINKSYRLANVSLNLKTLVTKDSNDQLGIQLLHYEILKDINKDMISEVHFEFSAGTQRTYESLTVPNLIGLTETAVRRILNNLGLKLNPVYQENKKVPGGDSFKQAPEPGLQIRPNDYVTVIFCKK